MKLKLNSDDKVSLSIPEAGALTDIGRDTLYAEINAGRLKSAKIRGRRVIRREALERWLADRERETAEAMGFGEAAQ